MAPSSSANLLHNEPTMKSSNPLPWPAILLCVSIPLGVIGIVLLVNYGWALGL